MAPLPPHSGGRWAERLSRSSYLVVAVLIHLVAFLMVATIIVIPSKLLTVEYPPVTPPPPVSPTQVTVVPPTTPSNQPHLDLSSLQPASPPIIISSSSGASMPPIEIPTATSSIGDGPKAPPTEMHPRPTSGQMSEERKDKIRITVEKNWVHPPDGDARNLKAKFVVYVAAYADGDWDCNTVTKDGSITAGAIPNLAEKIKEWTNGNAQAEVVPKPLEISSPELLTKMPPFIFFTGHKDFKLTEQEVKNLQEYLASGGAIWGDNAMAGEGSRFDVAFRREMRRVIPDKDKEFVALDLDHKLFTDGRFPMSALPEGMNYYAEPIEHIDLDGKLAILYTPNDYSDLMFFRILPGDKAADPVQYPTANHPLYTSHPMAAQSGIFYRNFDMPSSLQAQHLGMDIVAHLIVRFDDILSSGM